MKWILSSWIALCTVASSWALMWWPPYCLSEELVFIPPPHPPQALLLWPESVNVVSNLVLLCSRSSRSCQSSMSHLQFRHGCCISVSGGWMSKDNIVDYQRVSLIVWMKFNLPHINCSLCLLVCLISGGRTLSWKLVARWVLPHFSLRPRVATLDKRISFQANWLSCTAGSRMFIWCSAQLTMLLSRIDLLHPPLPYDHHYLHHQGEIKSWSVPSMDLGLILGKGGVAVGK